MISLNGKWNTEIDLSFNYFCFIYSDSIACQIQDKLTNFDVFANLALFLMIS